MNTSSSEEGKRDESRHTSSIEPALDQGRGRSTGALVVKTGIMSRGLLRHSRRLFQDHTEQCHGFPQKEARRLSNGKKDMVRNAWRPRTATGSCGPPREACAGRGAGTHSGREACTVNLTLRDCAAAPPTSACGAACYRSGDVSVRIAVRTCVIKASNSSGEEKRVAWPEVTCSTRPSYAAGCAPVSARNWTTNDRWGDKGGFG